MLSWTLAWIHGVVAFFVWIALFNLGLALLGLSEPLPHQAAAVHRLELGCLAASAAFAFLQARGAYRRRERRAAEREAATHDRSVPPSSQAG